LKLTEREIDARAGLNVSEAIPVVPMRR